MAQNLLPSVPFRRLWSVSGPYPFLPPGMLSVWGGLAFGPAPDAPAFGGRGQGEPEGGQTGTRPGGAAPENRPPGRGTSQHQRDLTGAH